MEAILSPPNIVESVICGTCGLAETISVRTLGEGKSKKVKLNNEF